MPYREGYFGHRNGTGDPSALFHRIHLLTGFYRPAPQRMVAIVPIFGHRILLSEHKTKIPARCDEKTEDLCEVSKVYMIREGPAQ